MSAKHMIEIPITPALHPSKYSKPLTWEELVAKELHNVQYGTHLRWVDSCLLTVEVCKAALKYECSHNNTPFDIYAVPAAIIDEVATFVKELYPHISEYIDKAVAVRKEAEKKPGYYGQFKSHEERMIHYKVKTFNELLKAIHEANSV